MRLPRFDREKKLDSGQLDPILEGAVRSQPQVPGPTPRDPDEVAPEIEEVEAPVVAAQVQVAPEIPAPAPIVEPEEIAPRRAPNPAVTAAVVGLVGFAGWIFAGGARRG